MVMTSPRHDRQACLFNPATIDADMPHLGPALGKRSALGKAQKEKELVDPQSRPDRLKLEALKRRQLQRQG